MAKSKTSRGSKKTGNGCTKRNIRVVILLTKAEDKFIHRLARKKDKHVTEIIREASSRVLGARA